MLYRSFREVFRSTSCCSFSSSRSTPTTKTLALIQQLQDPSHPLLQRTALSRAITLIESTVEKDQHQADLLLSEILKTNTKKALRIGITGPPGVGKSTFIESFGNFLTTLGHRIAVLAIDPSSSRSRGSLLGDKTRMNELAINPNAYVRPSPTRGTLGGVAINTNDTVLLCEAMAYDIIFVESVGLGQSEILIDDTVDLVLLLAAPAGGDELQATKKGIMEIADMILVTKADGELKNIAKQSAIEYKKALQLMRRKSRDWQPLVHVFSSIEKQGMQELYENIRKYEHLMNENNAIDQKRQEQRLKWMWMQFQTSLMKTITTNSTIEHTVKDMTTQMTKGQLSSRSAAIQLLGHVNLSFKK